MTNQQSSYLNIFYKPAVKAIVLIALSCFLQFLSFDPYNIWPLGFIALAPVFFLIDTQPLSIKKSVVWGLAFAFFFYSLFSYWLVYTIVIYGHFPVWLALLTFTGYCAINSSKYIVFFLLVYAGQKAGRFITERSERKLKDNSKHAAGFAGLSFLNRFVLNRYLAWPVYWALSEAAGWELFPFSGANMTGANDIFMQAADLFGVRGLTVFWFLTNLALYDLITQLGIFNTGPSSGQKDSAQKTKTPKKTGEAETINGMGSLKNVYIVMAVFFTLHVYGYFIKSYWLTRQKDFESVNFAVIQGNAPLAFSELTGMDAYRNGILNRITGQTLDFLRKLEEQNKKADIILWSESSTPFFSYMQHGVMREKLALIRNEYPAPIIINDIDVKWSENYAARHYNNLWLIDENGTAAQKYHKILLLPFGEFIPFSNVFTSLEELIPEVSNFQAGDAPVLLNTAFGPMLPTICYELMVSDFVISHFKKTGSRARLIINQTNDTWFGASAENTQHLELSRIRAIELRLPIVRAVNSGVSAHIDITGGVYEPTPQGQSAERLYTIRLPEQSRSLFSLWGYLPLYIGLAFFLGLQCAAFWNSRRVN